MNNWIVRALTGRSGIAAVACAAAALMLFAAALQQPKHKSPEGWVALNEQVEAALEDRGERAGDGDVKQSGHSVKGYTAVIGEPGGQVKEGNGKLEDKATAQGYSATVADDDLGQAGDSNGMLVEEETSAGGAGELKVQAGTGALETSYYNGLLDINRATADELVALPGIGPTKAQAIITEREKNGFFRSPDDLLRVKGIGEKILERVKQSIVVRP